MLITVLLYVAVINVSSVFADSDSIYRSKTSADYVPCDRGWYYFRDNCYIKIGRDVWATALTQCTDLGANLVSIHSQEEQDFITAYLVLGSEFVSWIGVNDRDNESDYKWTDGSVFNYTNWHSNEPSGLNNTDEDCVYMYLNPIGKWNDSPCTHGNNIICKKKANPSKKSPNMMYCSSVDGGGWKYKDSCYHIVTEMKSWQNAEMHCKNNYKGHLLSVQDIKEDVFLECALPVIEKDVWIGIKIQDHRQLKWTSGWYVAIEKFSKKEKFEEGFCAAWKNKKEWITVPCSRQLPFICKVSKETPTVLKSPPKGSYCPNEPDDWKDLGGDYCYYIQTNRKSNFLEARSHCIGRGGDLASIHSRKEADVLQPFIENTIDQTVYIGLIRVKENTGRLFEWTDGSALDYKNWANSEPNNYEEECVEVNARTMEWKDTLCDNKLPGYICSVKKIMPISNVVEETAASSSNVSLKTLIGLSVYLHLVMSLMKVLV